VYNFRPIANGMTKMFYLALPLLYTLEFCSKSTHYQAYKSFPILQLVLKSRWMVHCSHLG